MSKPTPKPTVADTIAQVDFKYETFDDTPTSAHRLVVGLVPPGGRVLEFGCATGYMSRVLRDEKDCTVVGIERSAEAAEQARAHCESVVVGDADELDFAQALGQERFDAILFADVLEHLRDPAGVMRRVRPFIAAGGVVVASIPNVAHVSVRLALLEGEFRYRPLGLLDDTHLRFFTRASIQELFESTGYVVDEWHRRRLDPADTEIGAREVPEAVRQLVAADPDSTTYQFVVRALPSDATRRLAATRTLLHEARAELAKLQPLAALQEHEAVEPPLEGLAKEVQALRSAHETLSRRLLAERAAMADRAAELTRQLEVGQGLREEIEWRTGVMERLEETNDWLRKVTQGLEAELATLQGSRSYRYTAPLRWLVGVFRRRP